MTGFGTPSRYTPEEDLAASEALGAARQERHELGRDGPAPSVEAILREMGRGPDGYALDGHSVDEFVPVSEAGRRALAALDDSDSGEEGSA